MSEPIAIVKRRAAVGRAAALAFVLVAITAIESHAQSDSSMATSQWYDRLALSGSVSSSYWFNANDPRPSRNRFHVFDQVAGSFTLDLAELIVQLPADEPGDAGFRVDIIAGSSVPHVTAAAGLLSGSDIDIKQAFATWRVPGTALRLDFGKFITHMGYEVIEGRDGINDNASRSFLFGYAIPFTHTGLRAGYTFSTAAALTVMLVNGWDNAVDNNNGKTVCAQLTLVPVEELSLFLNGTYGPERTDDDEHNRGVGNVVATWRPSSALTLGLDGVIGDEKGADTLGDTQARWNGAALYVRAGISDAFALALRGETFDDADGARTGVVQRLSSVTLTPEYRPTSDIVIRADLRYDASSVDAFDKEEMPTSSQFVVGLNVFALF
jgi:hypothetical protein